MRPVNIEYHSKSRQLKLTYSDGTVHELTAEYLRVYSPSAEVRGHSPDQYQLQSGKKEVKIQAIDPVGNYAIRLGFSDGHDSGIYSWDYLFELATNHEHNWSEYLRQLKEANGSRLPTIPVGTWTPKDK